MERFSCGTQIICGDSALNALKNTGATRLLMVCDPYFYENGKARELAGLTGCENVEFFPKVAPDPSVALAAEGAGVVQKFQPDVIVSLGGGSAMDLAKAMAYFAHSPAKRIAIPTTSGSGSEVTDFAILTHDGVKHPLVDEKLRPDMAIVDPSLVAKLPPALVADGGFDVLTHALEALVAKNASPITDALALSAFSMAYQNLPDSYAGNLVAREQVHLASTMAAMAFNQAGLGICHALAHSLGGAYHVPHGRLNAILLPPVIHHLAQAKYAKATGSIGLENRSQTMAVRNLHNGLVRLRKGLGLPATLAEIGIRPQVDRIVDAALADPCCDTNPIPVTRELTVKILHEAAHG